MMMDREKRDGLAVVKAGLPTGLFRGGFRRASGKAGGLRGGRKRILGHENQTNCYHVMSRTTGGEMLFGEVEKEAFGKIMRRLERFAGVEVLTYVVMGNHFHLLVRVPPRDRFLERFDGEGGEERLLEHLGLLYSKGYIAALRAELGELRNAGMSREADALLERFRERFCDLPHFVKELKERFSRWFNKHHGRRGTLWMERFKSVLVEDGDALRTMAAYIDLNPVRAGLAEDPKDYRWCGYAEAVAGSKRARRGLCRVMSRPLDSWNGKAVKGAARSLTAAQWYRCWLFDEGVERRGTETLPRSTAGAGGKQRRGVDRGKLRSVKSMQGVLSRAELLRCRVRYFSDGLAIGSQAFVEAVFREQRRHFGAKRKDGARKLREAPETGLFSLRALQVDAVGSSSG